MTGTASTDLNVNKNGQPARGRGIGWLMAMLIFSCIALVPFIIAAIVLLGH